jgi:uncharacterized protein (TIGR02996 family)
MFGMDDVEKNFLAAIAANPDDDEARSVYADWLDDRGDPRGEFLRLEMQLRAIPLRLAIITPQLDPKWLAAVDRFYDVALARGGNNKIGVIKLIREISGLGLKEAKDVVDAASDRYPVPFRTHVDRKEAERIEHMFDGSGATVRVIARVGRIDSRVKLRVVLERVEPGQLIMAIKELRAMTSLGLREAKEIVDAVVAGTPREITRDVDGHRANEIVARFRGIGAVRFD